MRGGCQVRDNLLAGSERRPLALSQRLQDRAGLGRCPEPSAEGRTGSAVVADRCDCDLARLGARHAGDPGAGPPDDVGAQAPVAETESHHVTQGAACLAPVHRKTALCRWRCTRRTRPAWTSRVGWKRATLTIASPCRPARASLASSAPDTRCRTYHVPARRQSDPVEFTVHSPLRATVGDSRINVRSGRSAPRRDGRGLLG